MSYQHHNLAVLERYFTVVARETGGPVSTGTVSYFLKARSGANAGKWWRNSDQTWQSSETSNAMTHDADGHWNIALAGTPFGDGVRYLEYVKESGDLHVPDARHLVGGYEQSVDSSNRVRADVVAVSGDVSAADNLEAAADGTGYNLGGGDIVTATVTAGVALTAGERIAIANEVESQIIDDTDSERVLQAMLDKIASANPSLDDLTLGGIASAVRASMATELARIDASISSRLASSDYSEGSGGGGGGVVQILPLVTSIQTQPIRPTSLVAYERGAMAHQIRVFDSLGSPIDLSGKTLQFVVESLTGGEIAYSDAVSVSGANGNIVGFEAPAGWHATPGLFRYAVRDIADGDRVWLHGSYVVEQAAGPH